MEDNNTEMKEMSIEFDKYITLSQYLDEDIEYTILEVKEFEGNTSFYFQINEGDKKGNYALTIFN